MHFPPQNEGTTPNFSLKFNLENEKWALSLKNGWNWAVILGWCWQRPSEAESAVDWPNRIQRRSFGAHALTNGALSNLVPFILVKKTTFGRFNSSTLSAKLNQVKNPLKSGFLFFSPKKLAKMKGQNELQFSWREKWAKVWKPKNATFFSLFGPTFRLFDVTLKPGKCIRVKVKSESRCESARKEKREVAAQNPKPGI